MADATYKLTNEGYPVLTCGVSDKEKVFHPFGIALTFNEKADDFAFLFDSIRQAAKTHGIEYTPSILIADSASAITNGFQKVIITSSPLFLKSNNYSKNLKVFTMTHRGVCWAHATRGIDAILPKGGYEIQQEIDAIQISPTEAIFKKAISLFKQKYATSEKRMIKELESWWFNDAYNTWYEGYLIGLPSTSNNIESFHLNGMKAKTKLSQRLPTGQFLNAMLDVMKNWSMDRTSHLVDNLGQLVENPNLKTFKFVPKITNEDYLAAYEWNQLRKQVRFMKSSGVYMVKAHKPTQESDLTISNDECSAYLTAIRDLKFSQLNPFLETVHSIHILRMNADKWELSECSCSNWLKNYKCSHMIATAVRLQLTTWNPIFLDLPLEKKNKRGARKKTKPALIRQSIDVCATVAPRLIEISTEDEADDEPLVSVSIPKKRGRPSTRSQSKKPRKQ